MSESLKLTNILTSKFSNKINENTYKNILSNLIRCPKHMINYSLYGAIINSDSIYIYNNINGLLDFSESYYNNEIASITINKLYKNYRIKYYTDSIAVYKNNIIKLLMLHYWYKNIKYSNYSINKLYPYTTNLNTSLLFRKGIIYPNILYLFEIIYKNYKKYIYNNTYIDKIINKTLYTNNYNLLFILIQS
jgi:hypothetical protein